jgi:hypothetical protein
MKKLLSILCAVLIVFSLCACGGNASCEHLEKQAATCLEPSKCKACGATFDEALGHSFSEGKCIRGNCNEQDPQWINWYTSQEVAITKAEAQEILSMDFKKPKNVIVMIPAKDLWLTCLCVVIINVGLILWSFQLDIKNPSLREYASSGDSTSVKNVSL